MSKSSTYTHLTPPLRTRSIDLNSSFKHFSSPPPASSWLRVYKSSGRQTFHTFAFGGIKAVLKLLDVDYQQHLKMPMRPNSAVILSDTNKPGKKIKSHKKEQTNAANVITYVPDIPEPTCRAELMKYWMHFTLDDKTANKMLWISDNGSKVCRRKEEVCPVLDRPERYEYSPQVLCKDGIWNTRAYWEVEYLGWVVIGATYEGAGRRANSGPSGLGENEESWGLCWSGSCYQIWYNGIDKDINDVPYCSTIGVYIDQPAGIISFYTVSGEGAEREVRLLQKVKTSIDKKIIPGFWVGIQSSCTILNRQE